VTGSLAAVAAGCVTHPIDLVKVRMQLAGSAGELAHGPPPGLLGTAAAVVRADGVRGLYSGISGSVLRQTTTIGARLGFYDAIKNRVAPADGSPLPMLQLVACGLAAGAASAALCNPAELVLVRMQADGRLPLAQQRGYAHAGDALARISREEGVAALWRGTSPTVARAMVVTAAQMSFYDRAKGALLGFLPDAPATHGLASLVAGGAAALSSNPFDVVKTRLQNMAPRADGRMPYSGFFDCFITTARTEGITALYKVRLVMRVLAVRWADKDVQRRGCLQRGRGRRRSTPCASLRWSSCARS
jgi:solute carrier family 25 oxoglutarate transporter 11